MNWWLCFWNIKLSSISDVMLCCVLCLLFLFTFFELCPNYLSCVILIVGLFVVVGVSVVFSWLLLALAFALDGPAGLTWTYCCFFSLRILLKAIPFLNSTPLILWIVSYWLWNIALCQWVCCVLVFTGASDTVLDIVFVYWALSVRYWNYTIYLC